MTPGSLAVLSIIVGVFPLLVSMAAGGIAQIKGCRLDEGRAEPCYLCGRDISGLLYAMFMCAWLAMFTLGLMIIGLSTAGVWALLN